MSLREFLDSDAGGLISGIAIAVFLCALVVACALVLS